MERERQQEFMAVGSQPSQDLPPAPQMHRYGKTFPLAVESFASRQQHLELDFHATDRAALVTDLICSCSASDLSPEHIWALTVSDRSLVLWDIVAATEGASEPLISLRCPEPDCPDPTLEIALPLHALREHRRDASTTMPCGSLRLRLPTGSDLRRWHALAGPSARATAARDLVVDGVIPEDDRWIAAAARLLVEQDPLAAFSVTCACPSCGNTSTYELDLAGLALERLHRHQNRLIVEVHRLASAYGWTEAAVMALPPWRRAAYLQLLGTSQAP